MADKSRSSGCCIANNATTVEKIVITLLIFMFSSHLGQMVEALADSTNGKTLILL